MNEALEEVYSFQKEISLLSGVSELLWWDMSTNMPKAGEDARTKQIVFVDDLMKKRLGSTELAQAIAEAKKSSLTKKDKIILARLEEKARKERKIPEAHRRTLKKKVVEANAAWRRAKEQNNYDLFANHFERLIRLKREEAHHIDQRKDPYETLMQEYNPSLTTQQMDHVCATLKEPLITLLKDIRKKKTGENVIKTKPAEMRRMTRDFIENNMSLPIKKYSLSESAHPFTTIISRNDVRITTRAKPRIETFYDSVHEAGHALYDLNLPKEYQNTSVYEAPSLGMHESQALYWEFIVCRGKDFIEGQYHRFKDCLEEDVGPQALYRWVNRISDSQIRINADEVSYCLHIILRYEFERDLIKGTAKPRKAKEEWNQRASQLFGRPPKDDKEGILQDAHWADGDFGYFPSYLTGFIYAVQLHEKMRRSQQGYEDNIRRGEFKDIINWLRRRVHQKGATITSEEILMRATGKPANPEKLLQYLQGKYGDLYGART
ncbi:hypothetical protein JXA12_02065 [Candidatus Woesearchaeota archaeon]|nr:hypothetical protein [Candidatus Woesearchaeota archaeon]